MSAHASIARCRLGVYEIQGLLAVGGLEEVYRARDTRLQRDAAITVRPWLLAADCEQLAGELKRLVP
jgi:hypothetical protein